MFRALREVGYDGYWIFEVSGDLIASSKPAWDGLPRG
jgi:sugar phosphate isomerase/epimerase